MDRATSATGDPAQTSAVKRLVHDTTWRGDGSLGPNRYTVLGLALCAGGALLGAAAWAVLDYRPLAAAGISAVILGAVSLVLGRSLPRMSQEVGLLLFEAGNENLSALVEEFGLSSKAIYLPTSVSPGQSRAIIPIDSNAGNPVNHRGIKNRLFGKHRPGTDDCGILVATPGSQLLNMMEGLGDGLAGDIESELSTVIVGRLNLADAVRANRDGDVLTVEVSRPVLIPPRDASHNIVGSPVASIVAALAAESLGCPTSVVSEYIRGRRLVIEIELQPAVCL